MDSTFNEIKFTDADVVNPGDYIPAKDFNPHNVRPWLIHNEGFVLAVVFADCEQDALDEAVDADKLDAFMIEESEREEYGLDTENPTCTFLGNASEPFDIESVGIIALPNPPFSFCALFNAR